MTNKPNINDQDLRAKLSPEQYRITRQGETEQPFNNLYFNNHQDGTYRCVVCDQKLFDSNTKFDSGSGWPSFANPVNSQHIELVQDQRYGMIRTEVRCANCGSHLGHLFEDGPKKMGGKRYCINSSSLTFNPETKSSN